MIAKNLTIQKMTLKYRLHPCGNKISNSENAIKKHYKEKYNINLIRTNKNGHLFGKPNKQKFKIEFEVGMPDFYYILKEKIFFIEVKQLPYDGLKYSQIQWIKNHPEFDVRLLFIHLI